jgi:inner membrane protein
MLFKTHLAVGVFMLLVFLPQVEHKWIFAPILLIASIIPDIDSGFSTVGKSKIFRVLQWFTNHRGFIHSFTICIIISVLLLIIYPIAVFPFFLGYGVHLLMDSFTVDGIRLFWPLQNSLNGKLTTGGKTEYLLLIIFVIVDVIMLVRMIMPFI